jgi:hypothetical protein
MKIPDPTKFEAKLRKAEFELGVKTGRGVPVTYQRERCVQANLFIMDGSNLQDN